MKRSILNVLLFSQRAELGGAVVDWCRSMGIDESHYLGIDSTLAALDVLRVINRRAAKKIIRQRRLEARKS